MKKAANSLPSQEGVMKRAIGLAAVALAVTLSASVALAYDGDDAYRGYSSDARQYGYQNGYNDGIKQGRHEGRERDANDFHTPDWRKATRGYQRWMGSQDAYARAYQDGYSNGFRAGYDETAVDYRGSRNYGWHGPYQTVSASGYQVGFDDGSLVARQDLNSGKPYNSNPRGRYEDCDRGYRREYGSKDRYRSEYANGYRAGYERIFGHRR
jgi:hypothetical protein